MRFVALVMLALGCAACPSSTQNTDAAADTAKPPMDALESDAATEAGFDAEPADATPEAAREGGSTDGGIVAVRPYNRVIPTMYNPANPTPLVILLHGFGASGGTQDLYFGLSRLAQARGFLYAYPNGTVSATGQRFWNATDACCDFGRIGPDDVAYINAIIDDMSANYNVDPRRIYVTGHSNGGFMAHRLACDLSNRIAAVVSLAGAMWQDTSRCRPMHPVSVLQVHGTLDAVIAYNGGRISIIPGGSAYPSARESVGFWVAHNRCGPLARVMPNLDLDASLLGAETEVERAPGCMQGAAELWSIRGGSHLPGFGPAWAPAIYDWMLAHPRAP